MILYFVVDRSPLLLQRGELALVIQVRVARSEEHRFLIVVVLQLAGDHRRLVGRESSASVSHQHAVVLHVGAEVRLHG